MTDTPRVTVIIVSYNRAADLRLAIESVLGNGYPNVEIVVVDNASHDDAADVAESIAGVRVVRNATNVGFAHANNQGLELASGTYIVLLNNDAVLEQGFLAALVSFLQNRPEAAAAGGRIYFWDDANPLGCRDNHYYSQSLLDPATCFSRATVDDPAEVREVATLSGAVVMIRRAAIDDVGEPFLEPEFFTYYEETDFFARAIRRGWRLYYAGAPAAWHRVRGSTATEPHRYYYFMERNRLLFAHRNLPGPALRTLLRETAQSAMSDVAADPLAFFGARTGEPQRRARRNAWLWAVRNRRLLERHRERIAHGGIPFDQAVRSIESRATYYDHERAEVAALVPEDAKFVIDIGCASGSLGAGLKRARPELDVRGIEPVAAEAERARQVLDDAVVGLAEDPLPTGWPRPDCVIFADVLEHLTDPWSVLRHWHRQLLPEGSLVVSLPNVSHKEVLAGLVRGRWDYRDAGILDRTHLRFFTRKTAIELLEQTGYRVVRMERVVEPSAEGSLGRAFERWAGSAGRTKGARAALADIVTVQTLLVARRG